MRSIYTLALILAACGDVGAIPPAEPESPEVVVSDDDPFDCYLDADRVACHCTIPAYSADAIAASSGRCNYLRSIAADLY